VDPDAGVTNVNTVEVPIKQAMLAAAARKVLLADSSKFGRRALAAVVGIDAFDHVVTDAGLSPQLRGPYGERLVCVPIDARRAAADDDLAGSRGQTGEDDLSGQPGLRGRRVQHRR
jgi:hypothetical protein